MDVMKFIMTKNRMCVAMETCANCPIDGHNLRCDCVGISKSELKEMIEIIEQWSKENPAKTYKDDFLEKFPNAVIAENICRYHVYKTGGCDGFTGDCELCWNEPIEE